MALKTIVVIAHPRVRRFCRRRTRGLKVATSISERINSTKTGQTNTITCAATSVAAILSQRTNSALAACLMVSGATATCSRPADLGGVASNSLLEVEMAMFDGLADIGLIS